ncbi:MAG: PIN domain-containing protein [Candidatus Omnitrophica bacterium]|nr:PIN domain-containing protein [Candidatus Omnitrophota bacterium]
MSKIFLDTNILVYTLDTKDMEKQRRARNLLRKIVADDLPVISVQVLQEFYVVATTKLKADPIKVKALVHGFCNMEVVNNDMELVEQAIDVGLVSGLSFWDSLIVAAAEKAKCELILTEDLKMRTNLRGIRLVNPFADNA